MIATAFLSVGVFLAAWCLTGWFRSYALAHQLVDIPGTRSSHVVATPRGAGAAIALTTLPVLGALGASISSHVIGLMGGGALVALIGFTDDHRPMAPSWRLLGHFAAAAWILAWFGGLPPLPMLGFVVELGWLGHALTALYVVWLLNLTNFMDGIDGIAGVEVVTVCLGGALLYVIAAPQTTQWVAPVILASATLGFLVWNWPPAKVFMGDVGSGFVGLMLAAFSLQAAWVAPPLFWSWLILLGTFVVDATVTLLRRLARRERVYEAHRSHAYQHAALHYAAHRPVTLAVGVINICWLLPIALLVASGLVDGVIGVLIAYGPLLAAALWFRAGEPQSDTLDCTHRDI